MNAVKNELAQSDAPFSPTSVAPTHPVELFRHLTHKIGDTFFCHDPKSHATPISGNSPSSREECACARPFDATQWRHELLCTACPVNSCSAICLALGSGGRFGTLGTIASSSSTSSRTLSCAPPAYLGFSSLAGLDPAGNLPWDDCLNPQTVSSHQSCFLSGGQLCKRNIVNPSSSSISKHQFSSNRISFVSSRLRVDIVHVVLFVRNCTSIII